MHQVHPALIPLAARHHVHQEHLQALHHSVASHQAVQEQDQVHPVASHQAAQLQVQVRQVAGNHLHLLDPLHPELQLP